MKGVGRKDETISIGEGVDNSYISSDTVLKGPFTKDVRLKPGFLDYPPPYVRIKQ